MRSSTFFLRAGLALVSFSLTLHSATAQADTWSINTNCNANNTTPGGGRFTDSLGAVWEVRCAQDLSGASYQDEGTLGQGIYACFKACDNRPQCTGFVYRGSSSTDSSQWVTGPKTGTGRCYFRTFNGDYTSTTDPRQYAAARLISNGTPQRPCPYYSNQQFNSSGANARNYSIACAKDSSSAISNSNVKAATMSSCMVKCNADTACTGFSWQLDVDSGIPTDDDTTTENGFCYFRSTSPVSGDMNPGSGVRRDFAAKGAAVQASSSSVSAASSSSSSSSSAASSSATALVAPSTPWSPNATCSNGGSNPAGGRYTDRFGSLWEVRCTAQLDLVSSEDVGTNGQGIFACWKGCNNRPGCSSFVYDGKVYDDTTTGFGRCYYRLSGAGNFITTTSTTVYAAARRLSGSPNNPCPASNNTQFNTVTAQYIVYCGSDSSSVGATSADVVNETDCVGLCSQNTNCTGVSYFHLANGRAEPKDGDASSAFGKCYFRTSADPSPDTYAPNTDFIAKRVAAPAYSSTVSSSALPSSSAASSRSSVVTSSSSVSSRTSATSSSAVLSSSSVVSSSSVASSSSVVPSSSVVSSSSSASSSSSITSSALTSSSSSSGVSIGSATSSGATSTGTCTSVPSPPSLTTLSCYDPANSGKGFIGEFTDACANRYQVYCGNDTNPGAAGSASATSINDCMLKCDAFTGCRAAVYDGGTCYFKTQFLSLTSSNANKAALIRYVPPNPNYAVPVAATGGGCGKALPSNITANGASVRFGMTPSDGIPRTYLIHIPQYYDINKASPIIFAFHGNGGTSENIEAQTGFNDGGLNPFAIAVYVQGVGSGSSGYESNPGYGSSATSSPNNQIRDREFLKQLVLSMKDNFCIDSTRIFATGQSNGGGFCGVIACDPELSVTFAAIAPNSGAFYSGTAGNTADPSLVETDTPVQIPCSPGRNNMAIFETHGTADPTISYYGQNSRGSPGRVLPTIPRWLNAWAIRQGMLTKNYTTYPGPRTTLVQWGNATGELGRLQHFRLEDWVHDWPNGQGSAPINVSPYIMEFFYRWTNPNRGLLYAPPDNSSTPYSSVTSSTLSSTLPSTASSSSSLTRSSSSTASSSSPTVALDCPRDNNENYIGPVYRHVFKVYCYQDYVSRGSNTRTIASDLANCLGQCEFELGDNCWGVSWVQSGQPQQYCYYKSPGDYLIPQTAGAVVFSAGPADSNSSSSSSSIIGSTTSSSLTNTASLSGTSSISGSSLSSTGTSSGSATSVSSLGNSVSTAFPYKCPDNNGQQVRYPNGQTYILACGRNTDNGINGSRSAQTFNDCLQFCSEASDPSLPNYGCTAVVWFGGANGVGGGSCQLHEGDKVDFTGTNNDLSLVAAIDVRYYAGRAVSTSASTSTVVSTTISSLPSSSASLSSTVASSSATSSSSSARSSSPTSSSATSSSSSSATSFSVISSSAISSSSSSTISASTPSSYPTSSSVTSSSAISSSLALSSSSTATNSSLTSSSTISSSAASSSSSPVSTPATSTLSTSTIGQSTTSSTMQSSSASIVMSTSSSSMIGGQSTTSSSGVVSSPSSSISSSVSPSSSSMSSSMMTTSSSSTMLTSSSATTASSSSAAATTPTAFPYACPANDGQTVVDQAGASYVLACGRNTNHGPYSQRSATTFNDCFQMCDDEAEFTPGSPSCTAFVFFGGQNGVGRGICQLKEKADQDFNGAGYDLTLVAAIRFEAYAGNTVTSSSSIMSSTVSLSTSSVVVGSSTVSNAGIPPAYSTQTSSMSVRSSGRSIVVATQTSSNSAIETPTASTNSMTVSSSTELGQHPGSSTSPSLPTSGDLSATSLHMSYMPSDSTSVGSISVSVSTSLSSSLESLQSASSSALTLSIISSLSSAGAISSNDQASTSGPPVYTQPSSTASGPSSYPDSASLSGFSTSSVLFTVSASGSDVLSSYLVPSSSTSVSSGAPQISSTSLPATNQPMLSSSSQDNPPSYPGDGDSITTTLQPTYVSVSTFSSQESPIPTCGAGSDTASISAGGGYTLCQDPYGNTYNVTSGKQYVGRVVKRAVTSNVNECLLLCNLETNCVGANYVRDDCTLFSEITGTTDVTTGPPAVAATRPPDVSTIYTAPRTSVSTYTTLSQPPMYGTSSTSLGGYDSMSGSPGSSPAIATPSMTMTSSSVLSSIAIPSYGSNSSPIGASPTLSSRSLVSVSSSSLSASVPGSVPNQYTGPDGASSRSNTGPASYSSGMTTSISQSLTGSASFSAPTLSLSSSSQSQRMSSSGVSQPSVSVSGSVPPTYGGGTATLSPSNSVPPIYGSSSATFSPSNTYGGSTTNSGPNSSPSNNSPPPYGGSGSTTVSAPTKSPVTPPAETLCPAYNNSTYTDSNGQSYNVFCEKDYSGTPFNPNYKRQAAVYTIQSCMSICDQYAACVAVSTDGTKCNLFSSVTGTLGSPGSIAALKISGPPTNVQTVTVCANRPTAYTTVWTTATQTTCPPNSVCTVGSGVVGRNGAH